MSALYTDTAPRHNRQVPEGWDDTVATTQAAVAENLPFFMQHEAAGIARCKVGTLDNEVFEQWRYFAIGEAICSLAKELFTENGTQGLIKSGAGFIVRQRYRHHGRNNTDGLNLKDIIISDPPELIVPRARQHYNATPVGRRLVANALVFGIFAPEHSDPFSPYQEEEYIRDILKEGAAFGVTTRSALLGASTLMYLTLQEHYKQKFADNATALEITDPLLRDVISEDELQSLKLSSFFHQGASLRIDEFKKAFEYYESGDGESVYRPDATGKLHVDKSRIPKIPEPVKKNRLGYPEARHEARLRCPALFVPDTIQLVAASFPEMVLRAQQQTTTDPYTRS